MAFSRVSGNERCLVGICSLRNTRPREHRKVFELDVSISRIKNLNSGGYKLEQEMWMDVVFAGSRCLRQQFAGKCWRAVWQHGLSAHLLFRSEERRVGKECRSRWSPYH